MAPTLPFSIDTFLSLPLETRFDHLSTYLYEYGDQIKKLTELEDLKALKEIYIMATSFEKDHVHVISRDAHILALESLKVWNLWSGDECRFADDLSSPEKTNLRHFAKHCDCSSFSIREKAESVEEKTEVVEVEKTESEKKKKKKKNNNQKNKNKNQKKKKKQLALAGVEDAEAAEAGVVEFEGVASDDDFWIERVALYDDFWINSLKTQPNTPENSDDDHSDSADWLLSVDFHRELRSQPPTPESTVATDNDIEEQVCEDASQHLENDIEEQDASQHLENDIEEQGIVKNTL